MKISNLEFEQIELDLSHREVFIKAVGIELRKLRKSYSLSGRELAGIMNVSQQQISRYECGVCAIPTDVLIIILGFFKITLFEFFKGVYLNAFDIDMNMVQDKYYNVFISHWIIISAPEIKII
nr:helix-turn-helix transcriptional regulator [Providencia stuartii]